jgi:hypothetical protein
MSAYLHQLPSGKGVINCAINCYTFTGMSYIIHTLGLAPKTRAVNQSASLRVKGKLHHTH